MPRNAEAFMSDEKHEPFRLDRGIRAFLNPFNPGAHPARGNKRFKELESEVDLLARQLVLFASIFLVIPSLRIRIHPLVFARIIFVFDLDMTFGPCVR